VRVPSRPTPRRSGCGTSQLLGAIEAGLVRTMEDASTVLRHASQPLGPVGDEWLRLQAAEFVRLSRVAAAHGLALI
jgi:hypothetical protein